MNRFRKILLSFATASLIFLSACGKEVVYQDLTELEANEILVVLYKSGIEAAKEKVQNAQEVSYTVAVSKDEIQKARQILVENKLPRKRSLGFSDICKETSIIPTPEQEKCRKLLALKGEIVNSLERIPGVVEADVVLNIPEVSEFSIETQSGKKPTASAVLMVRKDNTGYEITESRVQRFISNTVENLDPRDVAVIINFLENPEEIAKGQKPTTNPTANLTQPSAGLATVMGLNLDLGSVKKFKIYAAVMLVLLMGVAAALIMSVIKLTKLRQELKVSKAQSGLSDAQGATPPMLEGAAAAPPEAQLGPGDKGATKV